MVQNLDFWCKCEIWCKAVRYDKIVAFEPFSDGFGIMRDAQTAKPQTFWTGDGWFAYNLAVNLAQLQA